MAYSSKQFPRQDCSEKEKKAPDWGKAHLDYAEYLLVYRNSLFATINRLYESYNGTKMGAAFQNFSKTLGKENKAKLVAYRLGRTKLDLLKGEWLKRPLKATVVTENREAKLQKLDHEDFMRGIMAAKEPIEKLRSVGVDPIEGMDIPADENDPIFEKMSFKDKNEDIMQIILDNAVRELDMQSKTTDNFLDLLITAMCYGKVDISETGEVTYWKIDPRDAIFSEVENDPYLERCPLKGGKFRMTLGEVLRKYNLTDVQRAEVYRMQGEPSRYQNGKNRAIYYINGDLCVDVIHIEWKSLKPEYYKLSPKNKRQLEIDPSTPYYVIEMKTEEYESNPDRYMLLEQKANTDMNQVFAQVPPGKMAVICKWKEDIWEATRIAGIIDTDVRRKYFQLRKHDNPAYVIDLSYCGCLWGTVDGIRISLQQVLENFDNMFDITMYQILKELNRAKGKVIVLNRGAIPKKKKASDIIYQAVNDGFIDVDWTADGYNGKEPVDIRHLVTDFDLGFSSSFQQLLLLKDNIKQTIDYLTGINENREGYSKASDTVTNVQSSAAASRTITEHLFFCMSKYTEKTLMKICEGFKVSYAFYKVEEGRQILGDEKQKFLEVTSEIGHQDYGVYLQDGSKYAEIRQRMMGLVEASLQAKEIRFMDILKFETAETFVEAHKVLEESWTAIQKVQKDTAQREQEANAQMNERNIQAAKENQNQNFQQNLGGEIQKIDTKGNKQMEIDDNKAKNSMHTTQHKLEGEAVLQQIPKQ